MPFQGQAYGFNRQTLATVNEVGAVYGLFQWDAARNSYVNKYVGQTDNLRRRLGEHFNNPPIAGCTHFFAEVINTQLQRDIREQELITEFDPPGNTVGRP